MINRINQTPLIQLILVVFFIIAISCREKITDHQQENTNNDNSTPISSKLSWEPTDAINGGEVSALVLNANGYLIAGTESGFTFRSKAAGEKWKRIPLANTTVNSFALAPNVYLYAGTNGEGVYISKDNGLSWSPTNLRGRIVNSIAVTGRGILAGTGGGVYYSANHGNNWQTLKKELPQDIHIGSIIETASGEVFIATDGGVFLLKSNRNSWERTNLGKSCCCLTLASEGRLFAATNTEGIFWSDDNGKNWQKIGLNLEVQRNLSMQTTRDKYLFVGTNDGVYFTELSKDFWFSGGFQDREVSVLLEDPKDKIVFAGVEGSVYRVEFKF